MNRKPVPPAQRTSTPENGGDAPEDPHGPTNGPEPNPYEPKAPEPKRSPESSPFAVDLTREDAGWGFAIIGGVRPPKRKPGS